MPLCGHILFFTASRTIYLKQIFLFFLLLVSLLQAQEQDDRFSLRLGYGQASIQDLGEILAGDFSKHPKDLNVLFVDGGYLLKKDIFELPIDIYIKSGLAYFDEYTFDDSMELTLYIKAYWNLDFFDNRVRLGFAEGVSYVSDVLETEYYEALEDNDKTSKFLNYLDISIDFDFGRLISYKPLYETYIGCALKHRSGVFGLYNGVSGGSNYNTFYLEKNF